MQFHISFIANIARKRPELNRDKTRFQQHRIGGALGQMQRTGQTAKAATNYNDVGVRLTFEQRRLGREPRRLFPKRLVRNRAAHVPDQDK